MSIGYIPPCHEIMSDNAINNILQLPVTPLLPTEMYSTPLVGRKGGRAREAVFESYLTGSVCRIATNAQFWRPVIRPRCADRLKGNDGRRVEDSRAAHRGAQSRTQARIPENRRRRRERGALVSRARR